MADLTKVKAIAFDLDGTLIDSVPDLAAATQATLAELGLARCSEAQVRNWVGNGARMLMKRALQNANSLANASTESTLTESVSANEVTEAELDEAMPVFMVHYQQHLQKHSLLYDGVVETLTALKASGYPLAIVTNKPYHFTLPLLKAFEIETLFGLVLGGDSLAKMKPDPMPLNHILNEWQLEPEQLLMVGDSKNDIFAAKAAGVSSIGLTYGYNYGEDIGLSGPTAVCEQFNQILALLPSVKTNG
ncbi:phosphoglycolate phosphatase [Shewanella sp. KT0246]|uniref:phosphoglycolate phosphatase n=1 Tax=Shewanella sp. KT0246 TaxID=2815912 RepID=UPI001BC33BDB|nr:phosphoglycolate phosphatase [Shewanella sp. KT0246]GIU49284.1 phosphoglycolate phosphatase [Shewanella sp. KT0246]